MDAADDEAGHAIEEINSESSDGEQDGDSEKDNQS
jgi:hypothetical protein